MASFSLLPAELVEFILAYLAQPQLYAICRLNKGFHALALPYLYRNVDLVIPPGDRVPRIDWFCLNIIKSRKLAAKVESLRLGTSPFEQVKTSQRWLRQDDHFDNKLLINVAQTILDNETLVSKNDYLVDAVSLREYGAYAALLILQLPRLQRLSIADFDSASLEYVHNILRNLHPGTDWNQRHASKELVQRLTFIRHAYVNVDPITGLAHPASAGSLTIDPILNLSNVQELELCIPYPAQSANPATHRRVQEPRLVKNQKPTSITKLVVRHTARTQQSLLRLLDCSPQLRSFTYDFFCDHKDLQNEQAQVIDLSYWSDHLPRTLEIMVFSVEYCDTSKYFFRQPRIGERLIGFLDLTYYTNLRTLEVPVPFLTGDPESSLSTEIYPLLPPNLVHLSLRTDLLHSQFAFPMDMSILPTGLTLLDSKDELRFSANARMDMSYLFQAALTILGFATKLETFAVWQAADPALDWFPGQLDEFTQACTVRGVTGQMIYPMLLRWKRTQHWNLIRETTVYNSRSKDVPLTRSFHRVERPDGIPLGLACQYHLHALKRGQVRLR